MKKLLAILLCATIAMVFASCGDKTENTKNEGQTNAPSGKLIMATEAGFAPYEYVEGQKVVGIDIDIAKAIAKDLNMELEIQDMDFNNALLATQNGTASFAAAGISINPERVKKMDFTIEYASSKQVVLVKADSEIGKKITSEDELKKTKIGVQQGTTADLAYNNGKNNVSAYKKYAVAANDLKNGKIDCIVIDELPAKMLVEKNPDLKILDTKLFTDKYAFAVQKGNTELLEKLNKALEKLIKDGKIDEFTKIHMEKAI